MPRREDQGFHFVFIGFVLGSRLAGNHAAGTKSRLIGIGKNVIEHIYGVKLVFAVLFVDVSAITFGDIYDAVFAADVHMLQLAVYFAVDLIFFIVGVNVILGCEGIFLHIAECLVKTGIG